jgi:hypothetical protein
MPLYPGPDQASAWWTFQGLDGTGLLLAEQGRKGLHLTPRVLAAPNYGLGTNGKTGKLTLNGTTHYADMAADVAARWYTVAPTTEITVGIVARFAAPAANDVIFSCLNAGPTRGLIVKLSAAERVQVAGYDAAGAVTSATMTADNALTGRTRCIIVALKPATSLALAYVGGASVACTFAGGAGPIAYDGAVMPSIGAIPGGGNYHDGDLFGVFVWPRILLASEVGKWSDEWQGRT